MGSNNEPSWPNTTALLDISPLVHAAVHTDPAFEGMELAPAEACVDRIMGFIKAMQPGKTVAVFDGGGTTHRHILDPNYKANRPPKPPEIPQQMEAVYSMLSSDGIECHRQRGWEADDLLATLTRREMVASRDVVVVTRDKDLWQLIGPGTWCYNPMQRILVGSEEVVKRFGVPPQRILDLLSLMGDSSDNIPGVKGVGEKTAAKLIADWDTLDGVYANLHNMKRPLAKKLEAGRQSAYESRELVRLRHDVVLEAAS